MSAADPRPLSIEETRRLLGRHTPYENEERSVVCSTCRLVMWPCLPARFIVTLDAERARHVALREAALAMVDAVDSAADYEVTNPVVDAADALRAALEADRG